MVADRTIDVAVTANKSDAILDRFAKQFKYTWEKLIMLVSILFRFVFEWQEHQTHGVESFHVVRWEDGEDGNVVSFGSCLPIEY